MKWAYINEKNWNHEKKEDEEDIHTTFSFFIEKKEEATKIQNDDNLRRPKKGERDENQ